MNNLMCRPDSSDAQPLRPVRPYYNLALSFFNPKFTDEVWRQTIIYSALPAPGGPDPATTLHGEALPGVADSDKLLLLVFDIS